MRMRFVVRPPASLVVIAVFGSVLVARLFVVPAAAVTLNWDANGTSPPNGTFSTANNWNPNQVPGAGDIAVFNLNNTYTVTFTGNAGTDALQVLRGTVNFQSNSIVPRLYTLTGAVPFTQVNNSNLNIGGPLTIFPVALHAGGQLSIGTASGSAIGVVNGPNSRLDAGILGHSLGGGGFSGTLIYQNGAKGTLGGTLNVGVSGTSGTSGRLRVDSGANVTVGHLRMATASAGNGGISVFGAGSHLIQSGASSIVLGRASGAEHALSVHNLAAFTSGTGDITVHRSARINVGQTDVGLEPGGTFNANGNVFLIGGRLEVDGDASTSFNLTPGRSLVASDGARVEVSKSFALSDDTSWTFQSGSEFAVQRLRMGQTSGTTTTLIVDDATLDAPTGFSFWGAPGNANVTIRNDAFVNVDALRLSNFSTAGGTSTVRVEPSGELHVQSLLMATAGGVMNSAVLTVDGGGSIFTTGLISEGAIEIGHAAEGQAILNIINSGYLGSSGNLIVRKTGVINVDGGLAINEGSATIDGGRLNFLNNGGLFASSFMLRNEAQLHVRDVAYDIVGSWLIEGGADVDSDSPLDIEDTLLAPTSVVVRGSGSTLISTAGDSRWARFDDKVDVTIERGGRAEVAGLLLANDITSDAARATVTVKDAGSTFAINGSGNLVVGHASLGSAMISVLDGGAFSTGPSGLILNPTGTIHLDGGTLNLNGPATFNGGVFEFVHGTLNVAGDLRVGGMPGLLASSIHLTSDDVISVTGTTTIEPLRTLTLEGGRFSTGALSVEGTVDFRRGTLSITGASGLTIGRSGPLGGFVTLGEGQTVQVTNTATIERASMLVLEKIGALSSMNLNNSGSVVLDGPAAVLGSVVVNNMGVLRGEGTILGTVQNLPGGEIRAQFGKTLSFTGALGPNAGTINLQGGTIEMADPLTNGPGGDILGRGTLMIAGMTNQGDVAFSNGVTDVFGDVTNAADGRVMISGNANVTFWDDVTHNGTVFRVSDGSSATFFGTYAGGSVTGGGAMFFEGDVSPGTSPAAIDLGGDVRFGPLSRLIIELGGTAGGTQFDQVGIDGAATLDGTLHVSLIDNFAPGRGDQFQILTAAGGVRGTFSAFHLPMLKNNLTWNLDYTSTSVLLEVQPALLPGDYNGSGLVEQGDLDLVLLNWGASALRPPTGWLNDLPMGVIDQAELDGVLLNWGNTAAGAVLGAALVPEPPTALLLGFLALVLVVVMRLQAA